MVDSFRIETARALLDSVHFIVLRKQQLGEVRAILAGDAGDESSFAACRKCDSHLVCSLKRAVLTEIRATHTNSTVCACCFSHFPRRDCERAVNCISAFRFPQMKLLGSVPQV